MKLPRHFCHVSRIRRAEAVGEPTAASRPQPPRPGQVPFGGATPRPDETNLHLRCAQLCEHLRRQGRGHGGLLWQRERRGQLFRQQRPSTNLVEEQSKLKR